MTDREKFEKWFDDNVKNFPFASEFERNAFKKYADIVWQATTKAAVPEGWKLVPVEPTEEMVDAFIDSDIDLDPEQNVIIGYKAMLEAAPDGDK